jgi:hypothetical protein
MIWTKRGQGFLFARPLDVDAIDSFLTSTAKTRTADRCDPRRTTLSAQARPTPTDSIPAHPGASKGGCLVFCVGSG